MGYTAEVDLDGNATSLFTRCRQIFSRIERPRKVRSDSDAENSWPRPVRLQHDANDIYDDDFSPLLDTSFARSNTLSRRSTAPLKSSILSRTCNQVLTVPPWCRLPSSTRYTTLIYILFTILLVVSSTSAAPLQHPLYHEIAKRQAIPDRFGNTGNGPASVVSQTPPGTVVPTETTTSIISTVAATGTTTSSVDTTTSSPSPAFSLSPATPMISSTSTTFIAPATTTTTTTTSTSLPSPPANDRPGEQLQRTRPTSPFTPGLIAGIVGASVVVLSILIGIAYFIYRRKRQRDVQEIPIRRSKLGSRLGLRIFGSYREASRSPSAASKYTTRSSRRGSTEKQNELKLSTSALSAGNRSSFGSVSAWLDKSTIGRPKPAYVNTTSQFLELPRPLFADRNADVWRDEEAPWRPRRPEADAAPLGRLSGMGFGLGMGRVSGLR